MAGIRDALADAFLTSPPTWRTAAASNLVVFVAGSPVLLSGLSASGFAAAYLLGTLTWRGFGAPGFLVVVAYFVVVSRSDRFSLPAMDCFSIDLIGLCCGMINPPEVLMLLSFYSSLVVVAESCSCL